MTHISERTFTDEYVVPRLHDQHGEGNVETDKYLSYPDGSWAWADAWVTAGDLIHAIEIENDAASIRPGVAQAEEYAMADPAAVPVVYIPAGHDEHATVEWWRNRVPIIEVPTTE